MNPLLPLFFQETLRQWHFEALIKESKLSRERVHHFLKELQKNNLIQRYKPKGRQPHYLVNLNSSKFRFEKRLYGLSLLEQSGLFEHLSSIPEIKTAVIFGSFSRGDWGRSSDIDLFIYGDDSKFNQGKFEKLLDREIQVFAYSNIEKIKHSLEPKVISNIAKSFYITESSFPFEVSLNG